MGLYKIQRRSFNLYVQQNKIKRMECLYGFLHCWAEKRNFRSLIAPLVILFWRIWDVTSRSNMRVIITHVQDPDKGHLETAPWGPNTHSQNWVIFFVFRNCFCGNLLEKSLGLFRHRSLWEMYVLWWRIDDKVAPLQWIKLTPGANSSVPLWSPTHFA